MAKNLPAVVDPADVATAKEMMGTALIALKKKGIREGNTTVDMLVEIGEKLDALAEEVQTESVKIEDLEESVSQALEISREARDARAGGASDAGVLFRVGSRIDRWFADTFATRSGANGEDGGRAGPPDTGES